MDTSPRRIDVHHHTIPPAYTRAMARRGQTKVAGEPLPDWSPEKSIAVMDTYGTQTAILSVSAPGVYFGDIQEARDLARACNEFDAASAQRFPGRFGSFAVLPMPFADHACAEAAYALDVLKADGVVLLGSTEGVFLGDPSLDELMAELDGRKAIVFVHPNIHRTSNEIGLATPQFLVEFLCDTTRAAVNLILTGTMERYPNIRWILAHAGGFLPYIAWRLSLANSMPAIAEKAPEGVIAYIRRFYYDTALSPSPYAMAALRELVEPDHIMFGSDLPFAPAIVTGMEVKALSELTVLDAKAKASIDRANALNLFPKHRLAGEAAGSPPAPAPRAGGWLKRAAMKQVVGLVDRLRDR